MGLGLDWFPLGVCPLFKYLTQVVPNPGPIGLGGQRLWGVEGTHMGQMKGTCGE